MSRNANRAVRNGPTDTSPPGLKSSKFFAPPALPTSSMMILVNVVTTAANAEPMMNATASSTRLPRMMKSLKPFMEIPALSWNEVDRTHASDLRAASARAQDQGELWSTEGVLLDRREAEDGRLVDSDDHPDVLEVVPARGPRPLQHRAEVGRHHRVDAEDRRTVRHDARRSHQVDAVTGAHHGHRTCVGDGHVEGDEVHGLAGEHAVGPDPARGDGLAGAEGGGDRSAEDLRRLLGGVVRDQVGRVQHRAHGVGCGDLTHRERAGGDDHGDEAPALGGARHPDEAEYGCAGAQGGQAPSEDPPSPRLAPSRAAQPLPRRCRVEPVHRAPTAQAGSSNGRVIPSRARRQGHAAVSSGSGAGIAPRADRSTDLRASTLRAKTARTSSWVTASPPCTPASWSVTRATVVKHMASSRAMAASGIAVIPTTDQPACWCQSDSAVEEKRRPLMTTSVPSSATSMPAPRTALTATSRPR